MYLCVEITNCLIFTVLLQYTSINDFSRIDKIKTLKVLKEFKFRLRIICFLLEFGPNWCSCNNFQSVLPFLNSYMETILYWFSFLLFLKNIGNYKETIHDEGLRPATLLKKENLAQVFSCEFCKVSKNTFFTDHLRVISSLSYTTKLRKDLFPMKIAICGMGTFSQNISRYVYFQAMVFLWILISIKLSIDWGIKHQILRNLNFWWPKNCAILNLTNITWPKQIFRCPQA